MAIFYFSGSRAGTRTPINWTKTSRPAVRRPGNTRRNILYFVQDLKIKSFVFVIIKTSRRIMKIKKKLKQKLIFISLAVLILIIIGIVVMKYLDHIKPENQFDFDTVSPEGEFTDIQAADEESLVTQ